MSRFISLSPDAPQTVTLNLCKTLLLFDIEHGARASRSGSAAGAAPTLHSVLCTPASPLHTSRIPTPIVQPVPTLPALGRVALTPHTATRRLIPTPTTRVGGGVSHGARPVRPFWGRVRG